MRISSGSFFGSAHRHRSGREQQRNRVRKHGDTPGPGMDTDTGGEHRTCYVQYGCGLSAPSEWRNFDASPRLRFERIPLPRFLYGKHKFLFPRNVEYGDIVKGLPVPPESCEGIYCSHVLEHLSLEDTKTALHHTFRYLQAGDIFRLVLPDLEYLIKQYLSSHSKDAAISFIKETGLGDEHRPRSLKAFVTSWLGHSQHRWMWDFSALEAALSEAGFVEIRRALPGDSADPMFGLVESKERWDNCLGAECRKPV